MSQLVFIAYARGDDPDGEIRRQIVSQLAVLERSGKLEHFSEADLAAGDLRKEVIADRLAAARVAILLIGPQFLDSDHIRSSQLPALLQRHRENGMRIIPLIVRPCLYEDALFRYPDPQFGPEQLSLASFATVNGERPPLTGLTEYEREALLVDLVRAVQEALKVGDTPARETRVVAGGVWSRVEPTKDGTFYRAGNRDSSILVVLVHGVLGDDRKSWGRLPDLLREALKGELEFDLFSYAYPSKAYHKASLEDAGTQLRTALTEGRCQRYAHYFFVVHSAGGLVLKHALIADMQALIRKEAVFDRPAGEKSISERTRQIINVAVPHHGGVEGKSMLLIKVYRKTYWLWRIMGMFARERPEQQGRFQRGRNEIIPALQYENPQLRELHEEYLRLKGVCRERLLPCPDYKDRNLRGTDDWTLPKEAIDQSDCPNHEEPVEKFRAKLVFRGTHPSVKNAQSVDDPIVSYIAGLLKRLANEEELWIAQETVTRCLEHDIGTDLIGNITEEEEFENRTGLQRDVFDRLEAYVRSPAERPRLVIVHGDEGTGKSLLLRTFARRVANRYLSCTSQQFPIVFPTQQFSVAAKAGTSAWDQLREAWLEWTRGQAPSGVDAKWLERRLKHEETVLVLDSLDELAEFNSMSAELLRAMVVEILDRYRMNDKLRIVLGIRSTHDSLKPLSDDAHFVLQIRDLEPHEARRSFKKAWELIDRIADEGGSKVWAMDRLTRTPLILRELERADIGELPVVSLQSRSGLLQLAVRAGLKNSRLNGVKNNAGHPFQINSLEQALAIVAMLYAAGHQGQMAVQEIPSRSRLVHERWSRHEWADSAHEDGQSLKEAFEILEDELKAHALVSRSLFFPVDRRGSFRFKHRAWQDFLLGKYFAMCIGSYNVTEPTHFAFTIEAFTLGAELLRQEQWPGADKEFMAHAVRQMRRPGGHFIAGYVGGLLGQYLIPISEDAMKLLARAFDDPPLPRSGSLTLLAGIGNRVLVNREADSSKHYMRSSLVSMFKDCLRRVVECNGETHGMDKVLASLAWCHLVEFDERFDMKCAPAMTWAAIGLNALSPKQQEEILNHLIGEKNGDGHFEVSPRYKSAHMAYLRLQEELEKFPDSRPISVVHYLFGICLANHWGLAVKDVQLGLPTLLRLDSKYASVLRGYRVEELMEVYRICGELFHSRHDLSKHPEEGT